MEKPFLLAIGGLSGSGKTSLAAALLKRLPNAVHLDSDRTRKAFFGVAETTRLSEQAYTPEATRRVIAEVERQASEHIAAGKNVIVSATFSPAPSRRQVEKLARTADARFTGIWLQTDLNILIDRVERRKGDASDAGARIVQMQAELEAGDVTWPVVDAALPPEEVAAAVMRILGV